MTVYSLDVSDNVGTYALRGRCYGAEVVQDIKLQPKTVQASGRAGYLRLSIGGLTHPQGFANASGIVRMV